MRIAKIILDCKSGSILQLALSFLLKYVVCGSLIYKYHHNWNASLFAQRHSCYKVC